MSGENSVEEKKKIAIGTVVRVVCDGYFKGFVTSVTGVPSVGSTLFTLDNTGCHVFTEKDFEIVDDQQSVTIGDVVNVVSGRGVFTVTKTKTMYEVKDEHGNGAWVDFVVPVSEEVRAAHIAKRYEELRKKATAALDELNAFSATLLKTTKPAPAVSDVQ